jgi:hypothetical protein
MTPALQAAVGLEALAMFRHLGLGCAVTSSELCAQLGVTRSYAYEQRDRLRISLERDPTVPACQACRDKDLAIRRHAITIAVLEYRATHSGAWVEGRRTVYSDGLRELVMSLAEANADLEQVVLADACRIPLATLKQWRAQAQTNANPNVAPPPVTNVQAPADPGVAPGAIAPPAASSTTTPTAGFSLEMIRIIREYERWEGSLPAFVDHLRRHLDLHWGREHVTQLLHLAAARALLRRPPPAPSTRGSSFRPPPGVQWTSDGKQVKVIIDGRTVEVAWQPMVDVGSTATVGEAVRANEDTAGVVAAFEEGVATTGDAPRALLLDNKACNTNQALREALPDETLLMHATLGRPQNKGCASYCTSSGCSSIRCYEDVASLPRAFFLCLYFGGASAPGRAKRHSPLSLKRWAVSKPARRQMLIVAGWTSSVLAISCRSSKPRSRSRAYRSLRPYASRILPTSSR